MPVSLHRLSSPMLLTDPALSHDYHRSKQREHSPYQSRSMTAGLLESAPMHRRRHRTRITFPSTTPVAWDPELGLPCWDVLQTKKGAGVLPGWRGTHTRPTHRPSWVGVEMHPKVGREPSTTLESPWLVRPSSRTLPGLGLGSRGGDVSTDAQLSPVRTRWTRWLPPCIGPRLAAASAGPQLSWASGQPARTPPGREGAELREAARVGVCR